MAEKSAKTENESAEARGKRIATEIEEFLAIHDHAKQKAFYHAHPDLKRVFCEGNFH